MFLMAPDSCHVPFGSRGARGAMQALASVTARNTITLLRIERYRRIFNNVLGVGSRDLQRRGRRARL
jgi:hypothetical protein